VLSRLTALRLYLPLFAVLLFSLSFHEAAHAWAATRLGDPTARQLGRLTLNPLAHIDWIGTVLFPLIAITTGFPLIGWARPVPVHWANLRDPRRDFALVALAGPVSNVILAVGLTLLFGVLSLAGFFGSELLEITLIRAVSLNMLLAVFNMIPVPPLDGGNVLSGVVPEAAARGIDRLRPYGFLIIYALLLTGVLGSIVRPIDNFVWGTLL
jgi:Zn-dependent protease